MIEIKELFYKPFEDIRQRRGRGGTYDYITWKDIADRMNSIFGMNWSSSSESQELIGDTLIIRVKVCATDPESKMSYCQEGFGGAVLRASDEPGSAHKSAYSKALKDACKKWGIGLYMDDDTTATTNIPNGFSGYATGTANTPSSNESLPVPPSTFSQPAPAMPEAVSSAPMVSAPSFVNTMPEVNTIAVPTPPTPPTQENLWPSNNATSVVTNSVFSVPQPPAPVTAVKEMGLPPVPPPIGVNTNTNIVTPSFQPPAMPSTPMVDTSAAEMTPDTPFSITNVQEMAIKNLAKLKGYTDDNIEVFLTELINNPACGLNRKCPIKELSYNEAVCVIKTTKSLQQ